MLIAFYDEESVGMWPGSGLPEFGFGEVELLESNAPSESSIDPT